MKIKLNDKEGGVIVKLGPNEPQLTPVNSGEGEALLPLFQLSRILVPLDFSDCSKKALDYAIPFARQFGAELTLLHVVKPYPPIAEMGPVDPETLQDEQTNLEALRGVVGTAVPAKTFVRVGDPDVEIIQAAKDHRIDLIILSTHGRRGLNRLLLGSTAEKVVRQAGCPVLIVRENEHDFIVSGSTNMTENAAQK